MSVMEKSGDVSGNSDSGEKKHIVTEEDIPVLDKSGAEKIDEKKLIRRIDWALIPWLSFLYLLSFLDRSSIGNAKLYNMEKDLSITDNQYLICLSIFFISYAIFEVPSNVFLKRTRPSRWLSLLMLLWGIMMTVQGLVHNYGGLLGMRWMLGTFEAGLFPGVNYYLSCWYKRSEFGIRAAIFFSAATVSGAFGGLLAAAISNMDGIGGKPAWAWIFILEGLITVVAGAASFYIIQDFPEDARFLNESERAYVIRRLQADDQFSAGGESLKWKYVYQSLCDIKTWLGMITYMGADAALYAFSLFLPSIISELGFSATPANLLTVPVYLVACIFTCGVGFMADKLGRRGIFTLVFLPVAAIGYIILMCSRSAGLSYFATFVAACGIYPMIREHFILNYWFKLLSFYTAIAANIIAWVSNNIEGSYKRSVTLAMVISFGNINGAVSSVVYEARYAPWYTLPHGIILIYICIGFTAGLVSYLYLRRENARRERGERDEHITGINEDKSGVNDKNGRYDSVDDAKRDKGDMWSGFRYYT